jgi:hypothetical protein
VNERVFWRVAVPVTVAAAFITRWPFRSEFLYSWDSGNYALAVERIDIAAHRPHPPGYLGYIAVARLIDVALDDVNSSLVLWNIIATAAAAVILLRFAWEISDAEPRQTAFTIGAVALMLTSPLLWFYGGVAEIYASETLAAVGVAYLAWRVMRGRVRAIEWTAVVLPLVAAFKLTTALLLLPLVGVAARRAPSGITVKSGAIFVLCAMCVAGVFLWATPDLAGVIWRQFLSATSGSRVDPLVGSNALERLNHNLRDTFTAAVSMLGAVNVGSLAFWAFRDRRLPPRLGPSFALMWALPWTFLCVAVHIAKPGYLLPLLPLTSLMLAGFYARLRPAAGAALLIAQTAVNVLHFVALGPLPGSLTGGTRAYRDKTLLQRVASDLQPLTASTAASIRRSDQQVGALLAAAARHCPAGSTVVVAGNRPVDARRVMWYLPHAVVIYVADGEVRNIAGDGYFKPLGEMAGPFTTTCPVLWLAADASSPEVPMPQPGVPEAGVGFVLDPGVVGVTRTSITLDTAVRGKG